jgi:DNA-binding Lrp family transcriptional regulator
MILDETDRALLRLLQQDADQSAAALAKNLDMSQPAIWRRIKRLKKRA